MADNSVKLHHLLFDVRRSIRYHQRRRRYYDGRSRITNATPIILGSTVVASIITGSVNQWIVSAASALVAAVVIWDVLAATVMMSRTHWDLAKRFIALEKHLISLRDPSDDQLSEATGMYLDIEADEPPILRVLNILCFNEVILAEGYPVTELYHMSFPKRLLAHLIDIGDASIKKVSNKGASCKTSEAAGFRG